MKANKNNNNNKIKLQFLNFKQNVVINEKIKNE